MKTLAFDPKIVMLLNSKNQIILQSDLDALVNKVKQRLNFFLGEWFINTDVGIAYFQEILRQPVDPALIVTIINSDLLQEIDILSIEGVSIEFDKEGGAFTYSATIVTVYGEANILSEITV